MSALIPLGPSLTGTLVAPDIDRAVAAYCEHLFTEVAHESVVSREESVLWGKPKLEGSPLVTLRSQTGSEWLRILGNPDSPPARPFLELGWMALEVLVADVDQIADRLAGSPFEIYRPPSDPRGASGARVMQIIGLAGEVLYLTQVGAATAPLNIAPARCPVERLIAPVSACLRRDEALAVYSRLGARRSWSFQTPIASVNRAHGLDPSLQHAVATVQLAGQSMVEINQLGVAGARRPSGGLLPAGIAMVSFALANLDNMGVKPVSPPQVLQSGPNAGRRVVACRGAAGELIELIEGDA